MAIKTILMLFVLFIGNFTNLQNDIVGIWENKQSGYTIKIYHNNNQYFGKIIKVNGTQYDEKVGHVLLYNMVFDKSKKKYYGEVKTTNGMTANCEIELVNKDGFQLTVKKLFIKKTQMFKRTE